MCNSGSMLFVSQIRVVYKNFLNTEEIRIYEYATLRPATFNFLVAAVLRYAVILSLV